MRKLFDETRINHLLLPNRLLRSATWEGMCAADGRPTEKLAAYYATLAKGGVGLIITGYAFIRPDGRQLPGQMGIHDDSFAPEMRALTDAVHREGGKICLQLVHVGGQTSSKTIGTRPVAPSAVKVNQYPELPAALSETEIEQLVEQFAEGARRAKEYGFDAVQLHASHGYLINQFLSPLTNRRTDAWGVDVLVVGSQKALMLPPGLAMVAVSDRAWKRIESFASPSVYNCLKPYRKGLADNDSPYTPAITLMMGLRRSLEMIKAEGMENISTSSP